MKKTAIFTLTALLTACGGSGSSSDSSSKIPEELQDLAGSWQISCEADEDNESINGEATYNSKGVGITFNYFDDAFCSQKSFSMKLKGGVTYAGEKVSSSGLAVKKIGTSVNSKEVTIALYDSEMLSSYNKKLICNKNDWSRGNFVNISSCDYFSEMVDEFKGTQKDIYYISGDELYWGDTDSNEDENGFPNELERTASWSKS